MKPLGFGYIYGSCRGLGALDKSPAFKPGEYKFKALKDVSNIGEAWEYVYTRWKEASKVPAAKQATEIYKEVFNGLTAEFKKAVQALDWTQSEKVAKDKSLTYISQWSDWKKKLNTAWNILSQGEPTGKPKEPEKKPNGVKPEEPKAPATTTVTDLGPPHGEPKGFPWWLIGAGAVGIGVVVLLLGMRKKVVTANLGFFNPRNLYAKMRSANDPYEIWETPDHSWRWYVLKKYQTDDNKLYARWFVKAFSPYTPSGELGDSYASEIMQSARKVGGRPPSEGNPRKRGRYSPGVGEYVREEMHKIGKSPHVQSRAQAIKVGLEIARRAGLRVPRA